MFAAQRSCWKQLHPVMKRHVRVRFSHWVFGEASEVVQTAAHCVVLQAPLMIEAVQGAAARAIAAGGLSTADGDALLAAYSAALVGHTYLSP